MDDFGSSQWWRRLHDWADVIHADFQTVISRYLQNISTYLSCAAERMSRTIIMQNSRMIQACFLSKSTRFESTDFASVMIDDVGCSRRHQYPQCDSHIYIQDITLAITVSADALAPNSAKPTAHTMAIWFLQVSQKCWLTFLARWHFNSIWQQWAHKILRHFKCYSRCNSQCKTVPL